MDKKKHTGSKCLCTQKVTEHALQIHADSSQFQLMLGPCSFCEREVALPDCVPQNVTLNTDLNNSLASVLHSVGFYSRGSNIFIL